ncbi:hypothetical protein BB560_000736 [Smittium megazygosporum]|uniref:AAA+ ATPase domain-containing protein n=1 Tax=Smittium megazygosporum TaxID=133381 RepID=A0A2T9ZJI9_9FUNG|nr:hypothetical protein BB560_000736 [Smittium megazygosporum]
MLKSWITSLSRFNFIFVGLISELSLNERLDIYSLFERHIYLKLEYNDRLELSSFLLHDFIGHVNADLESVSREIALKTTGYTVGNILLLIKITSQQVLESSKNDLNQINHFDISDVLSAIDSLNIMSTPGIESSNGKDHTQQIKDVIDLQSKHIRILEVSKFPLAHFDISLSDFGGYKDVISNLTLWVNLIKKELLDEGGIKTKPGFENNIEADSQLSRNVSVSKKLLIYGEAGCGKSLLARALASLLHRPIIVVRLSDLFSEYFGETEKNIRDLFRSAKNSTIIIDDIESISEKRTGQENSIENRLVSTLLNELDGISSSTSSTGKSKEAIVIATTNKLSKIDDAIVRPGRFSKTVKLSLPSFEDRIDILKTLTKKTPLNPNVDFSVISKYTDGWSGARLSLLHRNACYSAMRKSKRSFSLDMENYLHALRSM